MRRCAVLVVLAVGAVAWGQLSEAIVRVPRPLSIFDTVALEYGPVSASVPRIEIVQKPWTDISGFEEGISEVRISPTQPTSDDEVFAAVSGWKPDPDYVLDYADVTILAGAIRLDLYWHNRPPIPTIPPVIEKDSGWIYPQSMSLGATSEMPPLPPVTQYVLSPFSGTRYQVKESLGTLAAGAYTLQVVSHDPVPGSASRTFVVHEAAPHTGFPWEDPDSALFKLLEP